MRRRAGTVTDLNFETRLDRPELGGDRSPHHRKAPAKSAHLIHDLNKSAGLLCYGLYKEAGLGSPELDQAGPFE